MSETKVTIELTNTEGIILSDLIAKLTKEDNHTEIIDEAEEKLLWDLECILEKQTRIIFNKNYETEIENIKTHYLKEKKGL